MPDLVKYQDEGQPRALLQDVFLNIDVSTKTLLLQALLASMLFFSLNFFLFMMMVLHLIITLY